MDFSSFNTKTYDLVTYVRFPGEILGLSAFGDEFNALAKPVIEPPRARCATGTLLHMRGYGLLEKDDEGNDHQILQSNRTSGDVVDIGGIIVPTAETELSDLLLMRVDRGGKTVYLSDFDQLFKEAENYDTYQGAIQDVLNKHYGNYRELKLQLSR